MTYTYAYIKYSRYLHIHTRVCDIHIYVYTRVYEIHIYIFRIHMYIHIYVCVWHTHIKTFRLSWVWMYIDPELKKLNYYIG